MLGHSSLPVVAVVVINPLYLEMEGKDIRLLRKRPRTKEDIQRWIPPGDDLDDLLESLHERNFVKSTLPTIVCTT